MHMEPKPHMSKPNVIPSHFPGDSPIDRAAPARYARETGPHVTANVRAVLRELARYADPSTGYCCPRLDQIAEPLEITRETVIKCILHLKRLGILTVQGMKGMSGKRNEYFFTAAPSWQPKKMNAIESDRMADAYWSRIYELEKENSDLRLQQEHDRKTMELLHQQFDQMCGTSGSMEELTANEHPASGKADDSEDPSNVDEFADIQDVHLALDLSKDDISPTHDAAKGADNGRLGELRNLNSSDSSSPVSASSDIGEVETESGNLELSGDLEADVIAGTLGASEEAEDGEEGVVDEDPLSDGEELGVDDGLVDDGVGGFGESPWPGNTGAGEEEYRGQEPVELEDFTDGFGTLRMDFGQESTESWDDDGLGTLPLLDAVLMEATGDEAPPEGEAISQFERVKTLTAVVNEGGSVTLTWEPSPDEGVTGYKIARGCRGDDAEDKKLITVEGRMATWYTDRDVLQGRAYLYMVRTMSNTGEGEWSLHCAVQT